MSVYRQQNMTGPKVSIIVPCFNQAGYLSETLDSVLAQTYKNWECVIVNDGSPDNTEEIAIIYTQKDNRIKYVWQENKGVSSARNLGISVSDGEYILPLDADDIIAPTYIERALNRFCSFPETKLVYCKANTFGDKNGYWHLEDYYYDSFIWNNCIFCTAMFRRVDYDKTVGYNTNMIHGNEDWDFWLSLLKKEDIVFRIDEVLFYYRVKENSRTTELISNDSYLEEVLMQLHDNHKDIYSQYYNRIILFHNNAMAYYENNKTLSDLRKDYNKIRYSLAYRVGRLITKPLSLIWKRK